MFPVQESKVKQYRILTPSESEVESVSSVVINTTKSTGLENKRKNKKRKTSNRNSIFIVRKNRSYIVSVFTFVTESFPLTTVYRTALQVTLKRFLKF